MSDAKVWLKYAAELAGIALIYIVVAKLSLALASINPSATPVWPTTGFAVASVLLRGYRIGAAIFTGAFIVNMTTAGTVWTSLGIATGNLLESFVVALCIERSADGLKCFSTPAGVAKYAIYCMAPGTMISATFGVGSLALGGYVDWADIRSVWTTWWIADTAGALVVAPMLLLWATTPLVASWRSAHLQIVAVYGVTVFVGITAFSPLFDQTADRTPLAFLAIVPLLWAALRCKQRETVTVAFLLCSFAVWGTVLEEGPFVRPDRNESFLLLLAFMIGVSVPSLVLSAEVAVRRRHEEHVDFVMRELSHRSKNLLSFVQSIANQVAKRTHGTEDFLAAFNNRLRAFARTQDLLVAGNAEGARIRDLVRAQLEPFQNASHPSIVTVGPDLKLQPKAAEHLGMALHELGMNAAKYGAFSGAPETAQDHAQVTIQWDVRKDKVHQTFFSLTWSECCGRLVTQPKRQGFGWLILMQSVPGSLDGQARLTFDPDGVRWSLTVSASVVLGHTPPLTADMRPDVSVLQAQPTFEL